MKLSVVISTSDAGFDALAFRGDLMKGVEMARNIGYDGVEIAVRNPKVVSVEEIKGVLKDMEVPAVGTGQAYLVEKLSLTSEDDRLREGAIERLKRQVDFASNFGAIVIIGLIRGFVSGRDRDRVLDVFVEGVREISKYAEKKGIKLVIEPLNRYESDFLNTAKETLDTIERIGMENVGILLDTFHMNIEERFIEDAIEISKDRLFHFHVSDSNRWAPGYGHIDFRGIIYKLEKIGYDGYVSLESLPLPGGARICAEKAYKFLKAILEVLK